MKRLNERLASSIGANEQYEKSINTVTGRSAIFGSVIEAIGNKFYNLIKGPLSSFLNYATIVAQSIKDMDFKPFVDGLLWAASSVGPWMKYIGRIISAFVAFAKPILSTVWDGLKSGYNFIKDNSTGIATSIGAVAAAFLVYKGVVIATTIATKATTIATLATVAAQYALNLAMSLNPIGLALAAISAAAVGIYVYWDDIKKMFDESITWITTTFTKLKAKMSVLVEELVTTIGEKISGIYDAMVKPIKEAVEKVKGWFDWLKVSLLDNSPVPDTEIGVTQAFKNIGTAIMDVETPIAESLAMFNRLRAGTTASVKAVADTTETYMQKTANAYTQMGATRSKVFAQVVVENQLEIDMLSKNAFAHKQYAALRLQGAEMIKAIKAKELADNLAAEKAYQDKVAFYNKQAGALMAQGAADAVALKAKELADKLLAEKEYLAKVAFYNKQAGALMAQGKEIENKAMQDRLIAAHKQYGESRIAGEKVGCRSRETSLGRNGH